MADGFYPLALAAANPDPGGSTRPGRVWTATYNRPYLTFDKDVAEYCAWTFYLPPSYGSTPKFRVLWSPSGASAPAASAHTVQWSAAVLRRRPNSETTSVLTETLDTANTVEHTADTTNARAMRLVDITMTNVQTWAAGDYVAIRFGRPVFATNKLNEDAWLWACGLVYTKAA